MVKHSIKKQETRKALFLYNIKTSEDKTERNLNEGKFGLKPFFKIEKTKALSTRRYRIYMSLISSFQVYDYSNLNSEYFADL